MDFSAAASSFLGFVAGGGTLTGLFTWGSKTLLKKWLEEDLEAFKVETRVWADATLADYTTKLAHLHANRASTIERLHELVSDLDVAARSFTAKGHGVYDGEDPEASERTRADRAVIAYKEAEAFHRRKSLYLDSETDELVGELLEHYWNGVVNKILANQAGAQALNHAEKGFDAGMAQATLRLASEAYGEVHEKATEVLERLTAQFREYLDVPQVRKAHPRSLPAVRPRAQDHGSA